MPDQPSPQPPRAVVNIQVSDVDPLMAFVDRLTTLHRRMESGTITTVEQARDELGRILALQEGETLG